MAEQLVATDGVQLCVESFGDSTHPAVLLIGGMGASMDWWDVEFCQRIADEGRFVIRYDHRDTGRSTSSPAGQPSYSSEDLTTDPLRILDSFGIAAAHLVGLSMGGGIAQELAAHHPHRVLTITLIATSPAGTRTGQSSLPPTDQRLAASFEDPAPEPAWDDPTAVVDYLVDDQRRFAGSLEFDEDRTRRLAAIVVDRTHDMAASVTNHSVADGSSVPFRLADIAVPTLVLHGTADPLLPLGHGEALAAEIPGASLVPLEGMGHEVPPPQLWDLVVPEILEHTSVS